MKSFLTNKIEDQLMFEPTFQQRKLVESLSEFLLSSPDKIFLLKGYAGTGKTSVISALIRALHELKQSVVLLAPTGRAAKVLSSYSGYPAYTIHKKIYRQHVVGDEMSQFSLGINMHKHTLFIVDEASMITTSGERNFGTGDLLGDLLSFVYGSEGCRLLLIGDVAQLPPVGQMYSPALDNSYLGGYGFHVKDFLLTEVFRQADDSGILKNATYLRTLLTDEQVGAFPVFETNFPDIVRVSGEDLIEEISSAYSRDGMDETIIVSRSNKRANIFNNGVRNRILYREEELSTGDLLMVVRNNYFWAKSTEGKLDFIANGDVVEVKRVRRVQEMYDFRFADVELYFPDYEVEMDAKILLDVLQSESASLNSEDSNKLFLSVQEDYMDIRNKKERLKKMREDPYLNALQVKFAYSVTCHKAQGGQWKNVFIDKGYVTEEMVDMEYLRWLYTAVTRASERLYLINWEK
ncbi:MAG: AAA family ATPase [Paludibacteraceae bacterium]|nr:AAA family ATPase [Paludibacteraceae bacterium]